MASETKTLRVGDQAPTFRLPTKDDRTVDLADYRGRRSVILVFYPLAWTPV
ncbi:hypothetical protein TPY_0743 [Sulfobacillus acidophilus TPY]|nr:hypothetical protein TPY_0743 [Sulfobacillus acidophilus TPY]